MPLIGAHVSISGSISLAFDRAKSMECTAFQIFTRNPRGWKAKTLEESDYENFLNELNSTKLLPIAHMPYLPNISSPNVENYRRSVEVLTEEMIKCSRLRIPYLVTHLGSHMGTSEDEGIERVAKACDIAVEGSSGNVMLLLENTAGQKNSVGHSLDQLRQCIDLIKDKRRVGICYDTCHGFAAGYDIRSRDKVESLLSTFDKVIGLDRLKMVHANDSKGDLNSHLDRHEHIGSGKIGLDGFRYFLSRKEVKELPIIIETPQDSEEACLKDIRILWDIALGRL
ncbi:MAG: deoxyribonuclease IV [Nitrososphaeria archaeon]